MDVLISSPVITKKVYSGLAQRVMIVDDHELFRRGLRDMLDTADGFHVVAEASCCEEALAQMACAPVDLVIMDLYLPDVDGVAATRELLADGASSKIVILSGFMDEDALLNAMLAGASGYLTKDMPAGEMIRALRGVQRGEFALAPSVTGNLICLLLQRCQELEMAMTLCQQPDAACKPLLEGKTEGDEQVVATNSVERTLQILTPQEFRICKCIQQGLSNKQIAAQLLISPYTVGKHVQHILRKLGLANRTQIAAYTSFEVGEIAGG
jgi:DNA-binding NarL/FixJ family response regulator